MKALACLLRTSIVAIALFAALPVGAQPPAAIADSNPAHASFQTFAAEWMQRLHRVEAQNKSTSLGNGSASLSYRGYDREFKTELRPTGNTKAPYIGMIRYLERQYRCADSRALDCRVEKTTPVTEVFRFQDGRWVY